MKETITQYVIKPVRIYTKLVTLSNQIWVKNNTLIPNFLERLHKHREEQQKVVNIVAKYKLWHSYLVQELYVEVP